jgi:UDP-glucose:(heptosyl)LPS alpha-1,3-glucosyltransferase
VRIALVILHADAARGGAERYTIDLAASLAAGGHEVSLLASTFKDVPGGVSAVKLPTTGLTRVGQYRRFLDSLDRATPPGRFDVIHAMLPVRRCDVYHPHAGIAAEAAGAVGSVRRFNRRRSLFGKVETELLTAADPPIVLCLSDVIGRVVERWYPSLPADRRVKLFNGVDVQKFRPPVDAAERESARRRFGIPPGAVAALMIAQDFERKGLKPAIEALALVDPKVRLVVAGRDDAKPYRALAARAGVVDRIDWIGPTDDPAVLYRGADLFVLPTRHDPCSLVVLEALASGVPVITTTANGAAEVMETGVHGVVLSEATAEAVAGAITRVVGDASPMGDACRALRPKLSWQDHLRQLTGVYEIVARHRRPSSWAEGRPAV